jgi:hypothetical protein
MALSWKRLLNLLLSGYVCVLHLCLCPPCNLLLCCEGTAPRGRGRCEDVSEEVSALRPSDGR